MVSGWTTKRLSDVTENLDRKRVPVRAFDRRAGPYPYYGASGIVDYVDGYIYEGRHLLIAEDGDNLRARNTPIAFLADGKFWVNNHAHVLRGLPEVADTTFLCYLIESMDIGGYLTGSTRPKLTQGHLNAIELTLPSFRDQLAIASILSVFDDKIELNLRTSETLEAMARAVFQSWFVDFDPVHAKADGRAPEWMDAETAALFPDRFGEDGVPEGWHAVTVKDMASIHKSVVKPHESPDRAFAHFSLPAFDAGQRPSVELGSQIKSSKTALPPECVLVSKLNPRIPRIWVPGSTEEPAICSTEFICLVPGESSTLAWLWAAVLQPTFSARLAEQVTGTSGSHQRVRPSDMTNTSLGSLSAKLVPALSRLVEPMLCRVLQLRSESHQLERIRNALLPRLLSGELRVDDAEKVAEEAL